MIYTVTLNPSIDHIVQVENFQVGGMNRAVSERMLPGGKGLNVSVVLHELGIDNTALGFTAGFTGDAIIDMLRRKGVNCDFIGLTGGSSRINVKLQSRDADALEENAAGNYEETEVNGLGPVITDEDVSMLYRKLTKLEQDDILVLAGSIPSSLPTAMYMNIMRLLEGKGVRIVVDATGEQLMSVIPYHPFLIKPNHHELGDIFGVKIDKKADAFMYARRLQEQGARNVLVSMGSQGAVLATETGEEISGRAPGGDPVYTVGAGDSMVAGFLAGYLTTHSYEEALIMGLCAGSASACSTELATRQEIEKMCSIYTGLM